MFNFVPQSALVSLVLCFLSHLVLVSSRSVRVETVEGPIVGYDTVSHPFILYTDFIVNVCW